MPLDRSGLSCARVERVSLDERLNAVRHVRDQIDKNALVLLFTLKFWEGLNAKPDNGGRFASRTPNSILDGGLAGPLHDYLMEAIGTTQTFTSVVTPWASSTATVYIPKLLMRPSVLM